MMLGLLPGGEEEKKEKALPDSRGASKSSDGGAARVGDGRCAAWCAAVSGDLDLFSQTSLCVCVPWALFGFPDTGPPSVSLSH